MIKATTLVVLFSCLAGIIAISLEKRDSGHVHEHDPHNDYHVPQHGYEPPSHHASSYEPSVASYSYETPSTSYGEPSYEPSYETPYNPLPDITPIIVGILALLGLSMLFPNNVRIDNVRRKRSAAEGKRVKSHEQYKKVMITDIY
jgi:hypothetical protein